jgi:hypothetical protein
MYLFLLWSLEAVLGAKYKQGKGKAKQFLNLLNAIIEATEDDKVTEEEFQKIVADAKALLARASRHQSNHHMTVERLSR